jgi:putative ABC transport system permease protein
MESLWLDLRYGLRMLIRSPSFTIVAVGVLALGIAAGTAIFSVVNAVLLRPLPYSEPDRLLLVQESLPKLSLRTSSVSAAEFWDYKQGNEVFSDIAAFTTTNLNLTGQGEAARIQVLVCPRASSHCSACRRKWDALSQNRKIGRAQAQSS